MMWKLVFKAKLVLYILPFGRQMDNSSIFTNTCTGNASRGRQSNLHQQMWADAQFWVRRQMDDSWIFTNKHSQWPAIFPCIFSNFSLLIPTWDGFLPYQFLCRQLCGVWWMIWLPTVGLYNPLTIRPWLWQPTTQHSLIGMQTNKWTNIKYLISCYIQITTT